MCCLWENYFGDCMYKERLKLLRESKNLTQNDVAQIISLSKSLYCNYETEYAIMPLKHLNTLCNFFNVSLDYIFNFNDGLFYKNYHQDINLKKSKLRLKEFRSESKLTQTKLAEVLHTTQSVIAGFEKGRNLIATPFLYEICKKYNVSADYLLGKIDDVNIWNKIFYLYIFYVTIKLAGCYGAI